MKFFMVAAAGLGVLAASAIAGVGEEPKASGPLKDLKQKFSYSIGNRIGKQIKLQGAEVDPDVFLQGLKDALADKSLLSEEESAAVQSEYQKSLFAKTFGKNKKASEDFLAANKKKANVKTTASGLQYEVVREGNGKSPKVTDTVTVNYEGKLVDGTVFDSSYKRGEPASFQVNQVIKGWTEALQLMKTGAKWRLFIPSELAYGENPRPGGPIRPFDALVFEVELISID
ncbi:FKBP-type peptidyl-prolyl cis-trans isomerase [Singulisphaera sp. PoT]|uniref:FKBP-type peptidyl-prolyl cis-trans isomerase n=1 Tax=Singulisphaera sp. PoT TaxID=3411797 RepID=UPI003BF50608